MNFKIPKLHKNKILQASISLLVFAGIFLIFNTISPPKDLQSAVSSCVSYTGANSGVNCAYPPCALLTSGANPGVNCLPNCANLTAATSITGNSTPVGGVNCYYLDKPLCTATSRSVSVMDINIPNIMTPPTAPDPRTNCADLIDLPLCEQVTLSTANPTANCVKECGANDNVDTATSGHNVTCVRFCDNMPNINGTSTKMTAVPRTSSSVGNCVPRQCHQLAIGTKPNGSNCSLNSCNKLSPDEMNQSRIQNEDDTNFAQYCDGSTVKCYEFSAKQLPFTRYRLNNTMCQIHKCKPATTSCGRIDSCTGFTLYSATTDDTLNISCNTTSALDNGSTQQYSSLYSKYINVGLPISDTSFCQAVVCKPTYYLPYPCSADASGNLTVRDTNCDASGDGSICGTVQCSKNDECKKDLGFCYKTIDCNLSSNSTNSVCIAANGSDVSNDGNFEDDTDSSFHRPVPLNKAYKNNDPSQGYRISGTCYTINQMKSQSDDSSDDHKWGVDPVIPMSWLFGAKDIRLGYTHSQLSPDRTRSPKACEPSKVGSRGTGYSYLCGNKSSLYKPISEKSAFYKGYVSTEFLDNGNTIAKLNVCLRFKNTLRPDDNTIDDSETCGSRECAISYFSSNPISQACGFDYCRTLTVNSVNPKECAMSGDLFDVTQASNSNNDNKACSEIVDSNLRLRAVQYGNRICAFVDSSTQFAYNKMFFDENVKLDDGVTCVSGTYNQKTKKCENGKDTNDKPEEATHWRTILKVKYTGSNTDLNGFYDRNGKFIKAQECVQVPLSDSPPNLYNLASLQNSSRMFTPPLFIRAINSKREGVQVSSDASGTTDFLEPEVVVQFGTSNKTLSIGTGLSGYESTLDSKSYAMDSTAIKTVMNGITYSANILIKKEFNSAINQPTVCLYQRFNSDNGYYDIKIGCANRSLPEIDNANTTSQSSIGVRKISITADTNGVNTLDKTTQKYGDATLIFKYCGDASCSNSKSINFKNIDPSQPTCLGTQESDMEKYKVCVQRDECSQLWKECMENEISIQNNGETESTAAERLRCQKLAVNCNNKKGITSQSSNFVDQVNSTIADTDAYGWFNEMCIVSGFSDKLSQKLIYRKITSASNVKGKCLAVPKSSLSSVNSANLQTLANSCPRGGDGVNCICIDATTAISGYTIDNPTPHEAGLCISIPTPKVCSSVNYGGDSYNSSSLGGSAYTSSGGTVNTQHANRSTSNVGASVGGGFGEFPTSVVGMNNIKGTCNGFWQSQSTSSGVISPKMNCLDNTASSTNGKWSGLITNSESAACVRFSSPAITTGNNTNDSDASGNYPSQTYTKSTETNDVASNTFGAVTLGTKGESNGYAIWPSFTKTNDFLQTYTATSCIAGYRTNSLPTRGVDQLGNPKSVNSSCTRITCPAINPSTNPIDWTAWAASKGASFGVEVDAMGRPLTTTYTTPASRSISSVTPGSTRKGYCNTSLGFFQAVGNSQPERDCLYDGTWGPVRNPCVSSCNAVTNPGSSDGFATWPASNNLTAGQSAVVSGTCQSGYSPYPYPRFKDDTGTAITPIPSATSGSPETSPKRTCQYSQVVGGGSANTWTNVSSTCVNQCPGYDIDTREGVGKTSHNTAQFGSIEIRWPSTSTGATITRTFGYNSAGTEVGFNNLTSQTASDYSQAGRTNGYFIVSRTCNSNYTWSAPVVQCATNGGTVNNSIIGSSGNNTTVNAGSSVQVNSCTSNFGTPSMPSYQCKSYNGSTDSYGYQNIDQYYYSLVSGSACAAITCNLTNNTSYGASGGSVYTGTTRNINVGEVVSLSCKSGFGKNIPSPAITNGNDSSCGRTANDRTSQSPTATCTNNNGVGTIVVNNDCSACRSCSASQYSYINSSNVNYTGLNCYVGCSGNTDQCFVINHYNRYATVPASGSVNAYDYSCGNAGDNVTTVTFDNCAANTTCSKITNGGKCGSNTVRYTCVDGDYQLDYSTCGWSY